MAQRVTYSRWGARVIAEGIWTADDTRMAREAGIRHLVLSESRWSGLDLAFLPQIPSLRCVEISSLSSDIDLEPVEHLTELRGLALVALGVSRFSFERLVNLREATVTWRPRYSGIEACTALRIAILGSFLDEDLSRLAKCKNLFKLAITGGKLTHLRPMEFPQLKALGIYLTHRLEDVEPLGRLPSLKVLDMKG